MKNQADEKTFYLYNKKSITIEVSYSHSTITINWGKSKLKGKPEWSIEEAEDLSKVLVDALVCSKHNDSEIYAMGL